MDGKIQAIQHLVLVTLEEMSETYIHVIDNIEKLNETELLNIATLMAEGVDIYGYVQALDI